VNPDLAKERHNNFDVTALKTFIGESRFVKPGEYQENLRNRDDILKQIKPISEENFYNLTRDQKYQMILKKSLEVCEYARENKLELRDLLSFPANAIFGNDKFTFGLHVVAFEISIELWGTEEQAKYWTSLIKEKAVFGTYVQTEVGHGTYIRGLETTATYDRATREFIIDSPTLTSTKFWPGASSKTCNHAIVMAQLIIDGVYRGINGFVVQLRSLENHKPVPGLELGDIGMKAGFDTQDNGYLKFNKVRIPLNNMLMRHARVTPDGKFVKIGNEMMMYASMLCLRGVLGLTATNYLSQSTTIAIRYSCVRRQTAGMDGKEPQIIEYQTQQYRLFPALATSYAFYFASTNFIQYLLFTKDSTNNFEKINPANLNKIHAMTAGMKACSFNNALKFSQSNRLCCGGHGYSLASGIPQIIQESDAGSTYEGDNMVLLLQTARYLLKCTQKDESPHLEQEDIQPLRTTQLYKQFEEYINAYYSLYDESMSEITSKLMSLVTEKGYTKLQAWNETSQQLITTAKVYINIYAINCFISSINKHQVASNQKVLIELLQLFILYDMCDIFAANFLRFGVVDSEKMTEYNDRLKALLPKIRVNAVHLVDAFDWLDANLCSALGAYDGRAYERLLDFAKNSQMNGKEIHEAYEKYQKPYADRLKKKSKL